MSGEDFVRSLCHLNYAYTQALQEVGKECLTDTLNLIVSLIYKR
jgi:hypothetical protein